MFTQDYRVDGVTHAAITVRKRKRHRYAVCGVRVDGADGRAMKRPDGYNPPYCGRCANAVAAVADLMERWENDALALGSDPTFGAADAAEAFARHQAGIDGLERLARSIRAHKGYVLESDLEGMGR